MMCAASASYAGTDACLALTPQKWPGKIAVAGALAQLHRGTQVNRVGGETLGLGLVERSKLQSALSSDALVLRSKGAVSTQVGGEPSMSVLPGGISGRL